MGWRAISASSSIAPKPQNCGPWGNRQGEGLVTTAYFPREKNNSPSSGYYFTTAGYTTYANLVHIKAGLSLTPRNLRLSAGLGSEWRATLADAIYTIPDIPVLNTAGRGSRYVGAYSQLRADYALNSHIAMALEFVHFLAGPTIVSAGGRSTDYLGTEIRYGW